MRHIRKAAGGGLEESVYHVTRLVRWLPAGPMTAGGDRPHTLVQFTEGRRGKMRTVRASELVLL